MVNDKFKMQMIIDKLRSILSNINKKKMEFSRVELVNNENFMDDALMAIQNFKMHFSMQQIVENNRVLQLIIEVMQKNDNVQYVLQMMVQKINKIKEENFSWEDDQ